MKFPWEETGKTRKLSRPWHGPYRVVEVKEPEVTVVKVYRPQDGQTHIHKTRVSLCPDAFPAGYHWYSNKCHCPDRAQKWVDKLLEETSQDATAVSDESAAIEDQVYATTSLGGPNSATERRGTMEERPATERETATPSSEALMEQDPEVTI